MLVFGGVPCLKESAKVPENQWLEDSFPLVLTPKFAEDAWQFDNKISLLSDSQVRNCYGISRRFLPNVGEETTPSFHRFFQVIFRCFR